MKCLSIASTKQNGHTRTPSLPAFLAFNVSPRSSCELVIPEKTYSPFEPCFSRSSRLISRLSSGRSPPCLVSNLHQDIWLRLFSFLFFENFSRRVCGLRNSWMHTRNSRLFICLWSEFPLGWPWTPRFLWNTTLREECKREKRARYFSCIPPLRYGLCRCAQESVDEYSSGVPFEKDRRWKIGVVLHARFPRAVRTTIPWSVRSSRAW